MSADVEDGQTAREVLDQLKGAVAVELVRAKQGEESKTPGRFADLLTQATASR